MAIYSPNGTHAVTFLDNYTNIFVKNALLRLKGIGDVFTRADDFSMRIWLQTDKLAQKGLAANDVVNALQEQNLQVAAGTIGAGLAAHARKSASREKRARLRFAATH